MFTKTILTLSLFLPLAASAGLGEDIARARAALPRDLDVAQLQSAVLSGDSEAKAYEAAKRNFLIRDFTGDGVEDVLVIGEQKPWLENYETDKPCESLSEEKCRIRYGKRSLHFVDGRLGFQFSNERMILGAEDGGVYGDPLEGMTLNKNGAVAIRVYGGSAWRWSYTDIIQYRDQGKGVKVPDFYVIGQESYSGRVGAYDLETKSVNLLTGQVIEVNQEDEDKPITKKYRVARKALVKASDYQGAQGE